MSGIISVLPKRLSSHVSDNPNCVDFCFAENRGMSDVEWIKRGLEKPGKSKSGLARAINRSNQVVTAILKGERPVRLAELPLISDYLEIDSPTLHTTATEVPHRVRSVSVKGFVQAGAWMEYEYFDESPYEDLIPTVGKWAHLEQFAYKVAGPSMSGLRIFDGDFVLAVPYWMARKAPHDGDVVIVERRRGQTLERTVKQLMIVDGGFELWPRTDDERFQEPICVTKLHDRDDTNGTTVEITGLVIGRWAPF